MSVPEEVTGWLKNDKFVLVSKEWCPFCAKAKNALSSVLGDANFKVHELESVDRQPLTKNGSPADYQDYMKEVTGARSVPRFFFEGKFMGGGDDVVYMKHSGQLEQLGIQAGVIQPKAKVDSNERYFVNGKHVSKEEWEK